ncbi:MAG: DmsE family decaheme c-type cytochrome [Candidatus Zixiibacteriota bacterium]|nr:MAG: DmsE family decaheme c-type cytochrome [candidate division Zixibacteria bacterium]
MSRFKRGSPGKIVSIALAATLAIGLVLLSVSPALAEVTNDVCAGCHGDVVEAFSMTPHGICLSKTVGAETSCEACHGDAVGHIEEGDPAGIINPAGQDQFGGQALCLNCHRTGGFDEWPFSAHLAGDVGCADCHSVHVGYEEAPKCTQPDICYGCHADVRAAAYMPSHHPVREGKLVCDDCHNPHGGAARLTAEATGRELCFSCHGEMEGPFIYEHAPVNEDCLICHDPHGAVADNLLKQTEPALCLSCHPMHFHATVVSVDGDFSTPQAPQRAGSSTPDSWKEGMLTKCTQCHTEIHGSDLPSQAISSGGNALTR